VRYWERVIENPVSMKILYQVISRQNWIINREILRMPITMKKHSLISALSKGIQDLIDSAYGEDTFYIWVCGPWLRGIERTCRVVNGS
jgi:hypothetical protein